jgi:hypothetical protein
MKYRLLVAVLGLGLIPAGAKAQYAAYFNPIVTPISNSQADTGPFAFLGEGAKSQIFGGLSIGGYVDLDRAPKYSLGIDVRDEIEHGNNAMLNSFLIGARLSGRPGQRLRPYVQISGGAGTTRSPYNGLHKTSAMAKVYGGADYALNKHIDWRMVEVGYGQVTTIRSSDYGGTTPVPSARLLSFTTGFVFRFP